MFNVSGFIMIPQVIQRKQPNYFKNQCLNLIQEYLEKTHAQTVKILEFHTERQSDAPGNKTSHLLAVRQKYKPLLSCVGKMPTIFSLLKINCPLSSCTVGAQ